MTTGRRTAWNSTLPVRTSWLPRSGLPSSRPRPAAARSVARDTGPSRATRAAVYERERLQCAACGKHLGAEGAWRSIQHRKARGVGGGSELSNLILLCGSATSAGCHRRAEDRTPEMHARGYWLRSDEDPRLVPVMLFEESGSDVTVWLDDEGQYSPTSPQGGAS